MIKSNETINFSSDFISSDFALFIVLIYSDCIFDFLEKFPFRYFFRRDFSSDCFWQTLFFKDFLVEVSSEICLVGVSLQRMVGIALQRFSKAFVGDSSFHFGRENFFRDSLFDVFFIFFLARKMFLEKLFGRGFSSQFFVR